MNISIIGAGMAGLLAGNMLRHLQPVIYEKQDNLPNNHSAVLRFRSSVVGDVLGVPFKKVTMVKSTISWRNPIADSLSYTNKCTGFLRSDRSMPTAPVTEERYMAPPDLIVNMAAGLDIRYGQEIESSALKLNGELKGSGPVISTMPMPLLMRLLDYTPPPHIHFTFQPGTNIRAIINNCDAYVSLYVPDPTVEFSRISISGNELILELQGQENIEGSHDVMAWEYINMACYYLGIDTDRIQLGSIKVSKQAYSKILPIDDDARKDFIYWCTDKFNIYALGRYATWRPKLLLDDLVNDIRLIGSWAGRKNRYDAARAR